MTDKVFFDTNILVYAHDKSDPAKSQRAQDLITNSILEESFTVSTQVLSEFYVTMTQKIKEPLSSKTVRDEIAMLRRSDVIEINSEMILLAIDLQKKKKTSYWDALIIVASQVSGCVTLYSEDLNSGQKFGSTQVVNPLI